MHSKLVILALLAAHSVVGVETLTLEGSIALAIQNATPVLKAQNNDNAAAADLVKAYLNFLPNLQANAGFGYENGNKFFYQSNTGVVNTENYGLNYQVSSTLNLFNGLADLSALNSAAHRREFSLLTLKRAKQLIALDVAQSFLQVVLDRRLIAIAQSAFNASKSQETVIQQKVNVGQKSKSELASQQAQTSANESLLLSSENQARSDLFVLLQKLRLDVSSEYDLQEPLLGEAASLDPQYSNEKELLAIALENRADLSGAKRNASAAEWDVTAAQAGYWPTLFARFDLFSNARTLTAQTFGGVSQLPTSQDPLFAQLGGHNYFDVTINLSWNIFDQWTTPRNVARASATARNLRIDAGDQERQVQADVRKGLLDYQTAAQLVTSSIKGATAAQEAYDLVKGRFDAGIASFTDLQVAQATLVSAQSARAQAVIGFELKKRALELALGR